MEHEHVANPRITENAFKIETRDPDQLDYRMINLTWIAGIVSLLCVVMNISALVLLEKLGYIDHKGNPAEISIPICFGVSVCAFSTSIFLARIDRGVLLDRRKRTIKLWRGIFGRRSPCQVSLDGFSMLRLLREYRIDRRGPKHRYGKYVVFRLQLIGENEPLQLFETEGEEGIRSMMKDVAKFLNLPVTEEFNPELVILQRK